LTVDGRVAGSWARTITARQLIVDVTSYEPCRPGSIRAVTTSARRYAQFLGLELNVRWESRDQPKATSRT
jgi:hypothetical protein